MGSEHQKLIEHYKDLDSLLQKAIYSSDKEVSKKAVEFAKKWDFLPF